MSRKEFAATVELTFTINARNERDARVRVENKIGAIGLAPGIVTDKSFTVNDCQRCDGRGFTAEKREGTRYVHKCADCENVGNKTRPRERDEIRALTLTAEV